MKTFFHILQLCIFVLLLLMIQFGASYVLPFPWNALHVPTSITVIYLIMKEKMMGSDLKPGVSSFLCRRKSIHLQAKKPWSLLLQKIKN